MLSPDLEVRVHRTVAIEKIKGDFFEEFGKNIKVRIIKSTRVLNVRLYISIFG
ncbi:MAG TPA: hypothetical protein VN278_00495 [Methanosarcina sp.]|nr:hypothetical protein [Methanosarcina sp.]